MGGQVGFYGYRWSPCPLSDTNLIVSSLLNRYDHCWRNELLRELVSWDVEKIKDIPISSTGVADMRYWQQVKMEFSEWKMLMDWLLSQTSEGSSMGEDETWKVIWKVRILPKAKQFIWWGCVNILPAGETLWRRHVPVEGMCPRCVRMETPNQCLPRLLLGHWDLAATKLKGACVRWSWKFQGVDRLGLWHTGQQEEGEIDDEYLANMELKEWTDLSEWSPSVRWTSCKSSNRHGIANLEDAGPKKEQMGATHWDDHQGKFWCSNKCFIACNGLIGAGHGGEELGRKRGVCRAARLWSRNWTVECADTRATLLAPSGCWRTHRGDFRRRYSRN